MLDAYLTVAISVIMGLSVFISMPIVFRKTTDIRKVLFYNAFAAGILVFLLMDIYGDVAGIFGNSNITNPVEWIFIAAFAAAFLFLMYPKSSRDPEENPKRTSVLAAVGVGFQNLTEGLLFGSAGAAGLLSIYVFSALGFSLQNITEGFPIAGPLIGSKVKMEKKFVASVFLLGGVPTIIGTLIGLSYYSTWFIVLFDALASAAILYVVLVLFHVNVMRGHSDPRGAKHSMWLTYSGILVGFVAAFIVNYIIVVP